jgi:hypothetical protein
VTAIASGYVEDPAKAAAQSRLFNQSAASVFSCGTDCSVAGPKKSVTIFIEVAPVCRSIPLCQTLPLPRGAIAFAASLIWLPNALSGFAEAFSCFGFLISRLLRFCPLAMTERPFYESCALAWTGHADRLETVLRRHPLMTLVIVANAVLR